MIGFEEFVAFAQKRGFGIGGISQIRLGMAAEETGEKRLQRLDDREHLHGTRRDERREEQMENKPFSD